jgi:hypothetical protein
MNPNKVFGQARIRIGGKEYASEPKATLELGGIARDAVEADNKAGYFSEKVNPSKLEASFLLTAGLSVAELNVDDTTVTFEGDTGQVYVVGHAYCSEPPVVGDGKAKVVYMGPPAEEMLS